MEAYKKLLWISTIVVIFLIIPLIFYFFVIQPSCSVREAGVSPAESVSSAPGPAVSTTEAQKEKDIAGEAAESLSPSALDIQLITSDEPVRELVKDCSPHPEFARWLENKNILRSSVAVVDNIANGVSPAPNLRFLSPSDQFKVIKKNGKIILDPASYIRYQPIIMVLVSIDSDKLVQVYRQLLPVLEEAYRELGYPGQEFQETLETAIEVLLKTPILEGDIILEEKVTSYAFADPRLEGLNEAQKHLLRMGSENVKKIHAKLREISTALKR